MASDGEDDYLSDKFLLESAVVSTSSKHATYVDRRKQAQRQAELKNMQNRKKSRRQLEDEARKEGLERSLFERAQAEEQELGLQNKAMRMMLKMGFKPGESLGQVDSESRTTKQDPSSTEYALSEPIPAPSRAEPDTFIPQAQGADMQHRKVPLNVDVWSGKKGVGLGKRAASPGTAERLAKAARLNEEADGESYRSRTRAEYEERRAVGRLLVTTRTLLELDEKAGVQFNVLSLDPHDPATFPTELLDALSDIDEGRSMRVLSDQETEAEQLRRQMHLDALRPLENLAPDDELGEDQEQSKPLRKDEPLPLSLSDETIEEAKAFLQLSAQDRLRRVLQYLREKYRYCFWCGTQYNDTDDLDGNCPGEDEETHD